MRHRPVPAAFPENLGTILDIYAPVSGGLFALPAWPEWFLQGTGPSHFYRSGKSRPVALGRSLSKVTTGVRLVGRLHPPFPPLPPPLPFLPCACCWGGGGLAFLGFLRGLFREGWFLYGSPD